MFLAVVHNLLLLTERMDLPSVNRKQLSLRRLPRTTTAYLDLIHRRKLEAGRSDFLQVLDAAARPNIITTAGVRREWMHALVGNPDIMHLPFVPGRNEGLPRLQPILFTRQRTMDEHQVDIS